MYAVKVLFYLEATSRRDDTSPRPKASRSLAVIEAGLSITVPRPVQSLPPHASSSLCLAIDMSSNDTYGPRDLIGYGASPPE
jgi:hypothetical protein